MSHLNSLCFMSCCWVLCREQSSFFFNTVFLYAFCKVVLIVFVQEKSSGAILLLQESDLF